MKHNANSFLQYFSYIVPVSFIVGGNRSTRRKAFCYTMYFEMLFSQLVLEIWFLLHIFISIYLKSHEIYCHHFGVIRDGGGVFVLVNGGPAILGP